MSLHCDVLVVGAGVAGVPAAVAAARAGAETVLVEKRHHPGGAGVVGLHRYICGLYVNSPTPSGELLNTGLVSEICDRLHTLSAGRRPHRLGKVDVLPYSPGHLCQVFTDMISKETRLRALFGTSVSGVHFDAGVVRRVAAGDTEIIPTVVVDCSGDGAVIQCDRTLHESAPEAVRQLAGYTVRISGLAASDDMLPIRVPYAIRQGVAAQVLPAHLQFTTFLPGDAPSEGWCKLSMRAGHSDASAAREDAQNLLEYLKVTLPAFARSSISDSSPEVLEREGPRLKGLYTLTERDVLEGRKFPDVAARSAWPIEIWAPTSGPTYRYLEPGASCDIPLRCLKAAAVENLLCAGRCISVTRLALGSTRVMGPCMAIGESAGREAVRMVS